MPVIFLIENNQYADLRKIGEIRNLFAHNHMQINFKEQKVRELCNQLNRYKILIGDDELPETPTDEEQYWITRNRFNFSVILLANRFLLNGLSLKRDTSHNINSYVKE